MAGKLSASERRVVDAVLAALKPKARVSEPTARINPYARVNCAYNACKGRFLPHGVGSTQHTSCARGRAALKAARS